MNAESLASRRNLLVEKLEGAARDGSSVDSLLVTDLTNVRYLTGFTGSNGACLVSPEKQVFLTDFRYAERAAEIEGWEFEVISGQWLEGLGKMLQGRVGFEDDNLTVRTAGLLRDAAEGAELVAAGGVVESLRRVKDSAEIQKIAAAAAMTDELYGLLIERGLVGQTEIEVDRWLTGWMREQGAAPSFAPIIASGPNGASPHAEPGPREIRSGELVTVDMGVLLDGYCSDCTRTFAAGSESDLDEFSREIYEITLAANEAGLAAVLPEADGADIDEISRTVIRDAGYGKNFGHGLGHGVGLEVHEAPRLGPSSKDRLMVGEVVTVEPGIYVPDRTGVRIEDLVVVGEAGVNRNLSSISKQLTFV